MNRILYLPFAILFLISACRPTSEITREIDTEIDHIRTYLNEIKSNNAYNGVVLIASDSDIQFIGAYGYKDEFQEIPNTVYTQFGIASMGKMFAAVSILQLYERGLLELDTTVGEILPEYPNAEVRDKVAVTHLLSHTSGLGDYFSSEFNALPEGSIRKLEDYLPFFSTTALEFEPGNSFRYSNAGYIVLGLLIEKLTGQSYGDYVRDNIFKRVGMDGMSEITGSAGGGDATIFDLHKFALGLKNNQLITSESFDLMTTDHFDFGYGFGMSVRTLNDTEIVGHNGGAPTVAGELDIIQGSPLIIASLSNRGPLDGWAQVRTFIRKEYFGSTPAIERFQNTMGLIDAYEERGFDYAMDVLTEIDFNISDQDAFYFADKHRQNGRFENGIDIMKLVVAAYPNDGYARSILADFYQEAGIIDEAIYNYRKSLELDAENEWAIEQLEKLEGE